MDTTKQQVEHVAGYISDVMVSVTINQSAAGSVSENDLYSHVGRAAGISTADQQSKISILVSPFYEEQAASQPAANMPSWVLYAALGGLGVFLILLLVILLISRRRKQKREAQQESQRGTVEAPPPVQKADIMEMQTERSMELRQDIRKFTEENPEIAAQMVRNWLREGETK